MVIILQVVKVNYNAVLCKGQSKIGIDNASGDYSLGYISPFSDIQFVRH